MRYILAAQIYWPIWLLFAAYGFSAIGMLCGVVCSLSLMRLFWILEFKDEVTK